MIEQRFNRETKDRAITEADAPVWTLDDNGVMRPMTMEEMEKAGIRRITHVRNIITGEWRTLE